MIFIKNHKTVSTEESAKPVSGQPETAFELINKYGTYNIQPTAESGNEFPEIAQSLPKDEQKIFIDKKGVLKQGKEAKKHRG